MYIYYYAKIRDVIVATRMEITDMNSMFVRRREYYIIRVKILKIAYFISKLVNLARNGMNFGDQTIWSWDLALNLH